MLQSLHIRDLALVAAAEVRFDRGLNVLSGATGGGKSLVVTALKLLRGEKAASGLVRHGADELRIDGEFVLPVVGGPEPEGRAAPVRVAVEGIPGRPMEGDVLVVTRIVDARGRSKIRVDGRPATLQDLRDIGSHLLEIHGQGETRALMRPEIQAETLDAFGGTAGLRREFAAALSVARAAETRLAAVAGTERARQERVGFLRFQLAEMDEIGLEEGEIARVEDEHQVLAHLDRLREGLDGAVLALQGGDEREGAEDCLGEATRSLEDAAEIDRELAPAVEFLHEAQNLVAEASRLLLSRGGALEHDPARLATLEERLGTLRRALRRFGPTEADFLARREAMQVDLHELDEAAAGPEAREAERGGALDALAAVARRLCRARRRAAERFVAAIEAELADLGMPHTHVRVSFDEDPGQGLELLRNATPHGPGPLEFEVRINPGEPFRLMRETASGGETARIVLAIKKGLADQDRVPFVVFDEIDAEIGGRLGLQVGEKLRAVSANHQTLIVTHLPQVAAFADAHFRVDKLVREDRTWTSVTRLDGPAREAELAAMTVGDGAADGGDAEALAEARRMVERARGSASGSRSRRPSGGVSRSKSLQGADLGA
ncbi:MAG: DNA repair protein RecN [Planctomycetota bacterium]